MLLNFRIALIFALLNATAAFAQRDMPENLPKFDNKKIHFGFQLGSSINGFSIDPDLTKSDSLIKLETSTQPGLIIHALTELHLGPYFGIRFTPGIAFAARDLNYEYFSPRGTSSVVRTIESTFIEAPILLKYRSKRVNNFAQYVMVGFNYGFDLASQQFTDNNVDERGERIVKLKQSNYNAEVGVGFDFFLEYFKFSPELKFSYGLNNIIVPEETPFSAPVADLRSRIFVFCLNFEG
ncbi:MAG: porin family protein [Salibacteraceae bacterium]